MLSFMGQKAGEHSCPRCKGVGCWACERTGYVVVCPLCYTNDGITKSNDIFICGSCGCSFNKMGEIEQNKPEDTDQD